MIQKKAFPEAALLYADLFDYPLTGSEIYLWTPFVSKKYRAIKNNLHKDKFFFIKGRRSLINKRRMKQFYSIAKIQKAVDKAKKIQLIPTVKMIGLTGGLSMMNSEKNDDIDFFIVTYSQTLWVTRFLMIIIIELTGQRRRFGDKNVNNKICLNMFVADDAMALPVKERDYYGAHEVLQLIPIFCRGQTYRKFLIDNDWTAKFFPRIYEKKLRIKCQYFKDCNFFIINLFRRVNAVFKFIQLWYMNKHITTEIISDNILRFHPNDARGWVMDKFRDNLRKYNHPLTKILKLS